MGQTIRVSLPGYNALTDTNLDHYALYADADNVLIKEFARGSTIVNDSSTTTITHNLGYIPFVALFYKIPLVGSDLYWICGVGKNNADINIKTNTVDLINRGTSSLPITFKYYIFYDNFS